MIWISWNSLTELHSDKPLFCSFDWQGFNRTSRIYHLVWQGLTRTSQFLPIEHTNDLTAALDCRRSESWKRLTFSSDGAVYIPVVRLVTCQRPFTPGVLIGYCLLDHLVIGWFQILPEPWGACRCLDFPLLFRHHFLVVISLMWFLLLVLWLLLTF